MVPIPSPSGRLPRAGADRSRRTVLSGVVVFALLLLYACLFASSFQQYLFGQVLIYGLSALGLDWLMGRAGQVSIGNGALMAVGAYTTAIVAKYDAAPFPVPLIVAALVGAAVGFVIAMPSLRLKGIYFALVTLALQFIVVFAVQQYEKETDQISGIAVPPPSVGGYTFSPGPGYLLLLSGIVGIVMVVLYRIYRRMPGRMWMAIKESELAASTIQVDVRRWKMKAFVGSSAVIAMAGSLLVYYQGIVSSDNFTLAFAITFVAMIIIGGVGSMSGALFGAAVVTLAPQALNELSKVNPDSTWVTLNLPVIQNGVYGLLVLVVLLFLPRGVLPGLAYLGRSLVAGSKTRKGGRRPEAGSKVSPAKAVDRAPAPEQSDVVSRPDTLTVTGLSVRYSNGAQALGGVDLTVAFGEVLAIVGRNGAGKSTLLRSLAGFFGTENVSSQGSARFMGHELIGASPLKTSRLGVVLVPERDKIFPSLTVSEHLRYVGNADVAREALSDAWPIIEKRWKSQAGLLSGGERQLLALAVAASLEPALLLVDEMSLGLAPVMTNQVADAIGQLRASRPMTIIIVEQNVAVASRLTERIYQLESGVLTLPENLTGLGQVVAQ